MVIKERSEYPRKITRRRFCYKRESDIGSGTFGTVFETNVHGIKHAVKMFTYADGGLHFTTIREIKTMRAIKSPYVLDIKEIMVERGKIYLLLEYFPNDLYKIIGTENFTLDDIRHIFWQILKGVEAMHDIEFLHRDLKTANILIKKEPKLDIIDNNSLFIEHNYQENSILMNESSNDYSQDMQDPTMRQNKWAKADSNTSYSEPKRLCIDGSKVTEEIKEEIREDKESKPKRLCIDGSKITEEIKEEIREDKELEHRKVYANELNYEYKIKICDFGMSRHKAKVMTPCVTTLWYRAPELLLGTTVYTKAVDIWSLGCILLEMFKQTPVIKSSTEVEALDMIVGLCGTISEERMPGCNSLPLFSKYNLQKSERKILSTYKAYSPEAADLADKMLVLNPLARPTIKECLEHPFFKN